MEIEFEFERTTKNCVRYKEVGAPTCVGTLYVQQWALLEEFDEFPERLVVTIEEVD